MKIKTKLAKVAKERGLTLSDVATRAGMGINHILKIACQALAFESIHFDKIIRIANILECSLSDLLENEEILKEVRILESRTAGRLLSKVAEQALNQEKTEKENKSRM